jgi:hypothetical protein
VQVVRHREEKAGDSARGGEKARPGGGFGVSLPLLAPWTSPDRRRGGKMGVSALPAPPPSPPGTWGLITSQKGFPKHGRAFPPRAGRKSPPRPPAPDCLADSGQEGQAEGRLSKSPQHQGAVKETPRGLSRLDLRVPELCPVRRGWGGSCPLATPRRGVQGQDEAPHRFWRELAPVELWGPRPRVPPYPGPRDIKGERGGKVGRGRAFPRGLRPFGRGFCNPARPKLG